MLSFVKTIVEQIKASWLAKFKMVKRLLRISMIVLKGAMLMKRFVIRKQVK
ncbi:hypothetical protein D3C84_1268420 [compost metagenome]